MKKFIQNGKNNNSSPHSNLPSTAVTTATAKTTKAPYRNTAHPTMDTTTTTQQQQPPPPPPTTTNTTTTTTVVVTAVAVAVARKKKRVCRFPGCTSVIKSQGHCQRHGAIVKVCKVREIQECREILYVLFYFYMSNFKNCFILIFRMFPFFRVCTPNKLLIYYQTGGWV